MLLSRINLLFCIVLSGCASTPQDNAADPFEPFNRGVYKFNDRVDKAVVKPVAKAYNAAIPEPARNMVRNFFSNLDDIVVTLNDLLQLKFAQAANDGTRVLFNTTFGVFGLFNFADRLEKHNEDFGQTLGYWGVGSGPYIVLPFLGPSSARDAVGVYVDGESGPIHDVSDIRARNQMYVIKFVSVRAGLLKQEDVFEDAANIDRYAFIRDAYLQRRLSLVHDGSPPRERYEDDEKDGDSDAGLTADTPDNPSAPETDTRAEPAADETSDAPVAE